VPPDTDRPRAWRRAGRWRIWDPGGTADGERAQPDLQDAVTVAILARELAAAGAASGEPDEGGAR
jgi:hypothetical protein